MGVPLTNGIVIFTKAGMGSEDRVGKFEFLMDFAPGSTLLNGKIIGRKIFVLLIFR